MRKWLIGMLIICSFLALVTQKNVEFGTNLQFCDFLFFVEDVVSIKFGIESYGYSSEKQETVIHKENYVKVLGKTLYYTKNVELIREY